MKLKKTVLILGFATMLVSCGGGDKKVETPQAPQAEEVKDTINNTYTDATYGYTITYPKALLVHQQGAGSADKQVFKSAEGQTELTIYRDIRLAGKDTLSLDKAFEQDRTTKSDRQVIYNKMNPRFYTVTGVEKGKAYVQKSIAVDNKIITAKLVYSKDEKDKFSPIALALMDTFK